jgi:hypothetical protein
LIDFFLFFSRLEISGKSFRHCKSLVVGDQLMALIIHGRTLTHLLPELYQKFEACVTISNCIALTSYRVAEKKSREESELKSSFAHFSNFIFFKPLK